MKNRKDPLASYHYTKNTRMIVEGAMMIALAVVLSYFKIFTMAQGGSVTLGSMIPILLFAYRWGGGNGMLVAVVYGVIQYILDGYTATPVAVLLDYPLAFGSLGLVGFIAHRTNNVYKLGAGMAVSILFRFIFHVISGVVFYASYAGEMDPLQYSLLYNSFLLAEFAINFAIAFVLFPYLKKFSQK